MPERHRKLADLLWESVPGLKTLFFQNGEITLQHCGIFSDAEIIELASEVLRPFLMEELRLLTAPPVEIKTLVVIEPPEGTPGETLVKPTPLEVLKGWISRLVSRLRGKAETSQEA